MKKISLLALALTMALRIMASPAFPEKITFQQPHSETQLDIFLKGDEKVHWAETLDGYSLLYDDFHRLVYATRDEQGNMVPSPFVATEIKDRSFAVMDFLSMTPKHLLYSERQVKEMVSLWNDLSKMKKPAKTMENVLGEKRFLVILFAFNDLAFNHNKVEFRNLFNQVGYSTSNSVGSVHDYYYDVSHHQFSLQVDVVGPYRGQFDKDFYGDNDDQYNGYQTFAEEAVEMASHDVNFDDYDNDGDGYIDGLHIIFAGYGEEAGGGENCIWSHKWNIFSSPTYNNTIVNVYSCSPELSGNMGTSLTAIGVVCHELGHVFGAPDYYDTDYAGSGGQYPGLGTWDIMSSGSWNRGGKSPAHHNPYTKIYIYKWASCDTLSDPQNVLMHNVTSCNTDFHRINTSTEGDFFLLENRMMLKWDKPLGAQGMLVYHIHPNAHGASVSNYTHPMQIYIMGHTSSTYPTNDVGSYGDISGQYAVMPRMNSQFDSLTDYSVPALRPWSQVANHTPLTHISVNAQDSTVAFCFKNTLPAPFSFDAQGISHSQVYLQWERFGNYPYVVTMATTERGMIPQQRYSTGDLVDAGRTVVYKGSEDHCLVDSLCSDTNYFFQIFLCLNDSTYTDGLSAWASPLECEASHWSEENFNELREGEIPACWELLSGNWSTSSSNDEHHANDLSLFCSDHSMDNIISAAPFGLDSTGNMVVSFRIYTGSLSDSMEVLYKPTPLADWQSAGLFGSKSQDWITHYANLPEVSQYSRIAFRYAGQGYVYLDDIQLHQGYLVTASCDPHGSISPKGYQVAQLGDSIHFTINREGGYQVKRVLVDGRSKSFVHGNRTSAYTLAVSGSHMVHVEMVRDLAIDECDDQMRIFPNPTQGDVQVELSEATTMTLYDIAGRQLWLSKAPAGCTTIPMAHLPRGIYILRTDSTATKIVKR